MTNFIFRRKSFRIYKAIENKKIFQQQEIDIEMDENIRSNFEQSRLSNI